MKDIPSFEGRYAVTRDGDVWSHLTEKFLSTHKCDKGYVRTGLELKGDKTFVARIHRLVALTYLINDSPEEKTQINHKNGIKTDNNVENLEWCTPRENIAHAVKTGLKKKTTRKNLENMWGKVRKLTNEQVLEIRMERKEKGTLYKDIAKKYGVSRETIRYCCLGRTYSHIKKLEEGV